MPLKREPCRNFQRGSCRFGDKCKFLHVTQQQPKQNVFGFGSQTVVPFQQTNSQQQTPNPFGFGVKSGPAGGAPSSGGYKPFENKWVRSEQSANQSQTASHQCSDPESCKRLIEEDIRQEKPLWPLTCYGHYKHLPCDITGDVSYEELRAAAYDEAKRGINLQAIIEREKNLVNSKLSEYEMLCQKPYTKQTQPAQPNQNPFSAFGPTPASLAPQITGPPVSSHSQQGSSLNMGFGVRPSAPQNNAFGQFQGSPGPFGSNNMPSGPFGSQAPSQTGGSPFTSNTAGFSFGNTDSGMNSQSSQPFPAQKGGSLFTSNTTGFNFGGMSNQVSQQTLTPSVFPPVQPPSFNQSPFSSNGFTSTNGAAEQVSTNMEPPISASQELSPVDVSVWLKKEWKVGEIPEQPPPAAYVYDE